MKKENKSFAIQFVVGIAAGIVSNFAGKLYALFVMVAVLGITILVLNRILGKEKPVWWFKNGGWIYLFMWLISWTIAYNL